MSSGADKIKTPLTMSRRDFDEMLLESLKGLRKDMTEIADGLESLLGPPPQPDLKLVESKETDDA
jgi:hypothetical protein